jgi:hypothetical protein
MGKVQTREPRSMSAVAWFRQLRCKWRYPWHQMCANLQVMRQFRCYALLALLSGSAALLLAIPAHACVYSSTPVRVQPTFSVRVYNGFGPVEGLKLKIVSLQSEHPLAEATTNNKGIAVFQLQKPLGGGGGLYLQPEHNVIGWQWPELDVETNATESSIEIPWPSQVLRSRSLRGTIQIQDFANPSQVFPLIRASLSLRSLVSYEEIATAVTDERGAFQFAGIRPGLYYLQVNGKYKSDPRVPQGDIAVYVGSAEANDGLSIITRYSDCGLEYESGRKFTDSWRKIPITPISHSPIARLCYLIATSCRSFTADSAPSGVSSCLK